MRREGKRKLENLVVHKSPQRQLLGVLVALKPHDAWSLVARGESPCPQHRSLRLTDVLRHVGSHRDEHSPVAGNSSFKWLACGCSKSRSCCEARSDDRRRRHLADASAAAASASQ